MIIYDAEIRLIPTPPAFVEIKNMSVFGS